ncbi:MAG: hypothetical protein IOD12_12735 [Silvanigrellales bacterium]|nr:hypothetical protein [Silvanigrellales bacterium]
MGVGFLTPAIGLVNHLVFVRIFGAGNELDSYLIATGIIISFEAISILPLQQMLQEYLRHDDVDQIGRLETFQSAFFMAVISGMLTYILIRMAPAVVESIYINDSIPQSRHESIIELGLTMALSIITTPALFVLDKLLAAQGKYFFCYVTSAVAAALTGGWVLYGYLSGNPSGLEAYAYIRPISNFIQLLALLSVTARGGQFTSWRPSLRSARKLAMISIPFKAASTLSGLAVTSIVSRSASTWTSGAATHYYMAEKIGLAAYSVIIGPLGKIFQTELARSLHNGDTLRIVHLRRRQILESGAFLLLCVAGIVSGMFLLDTLGFKIFSGLDLWLLATMLALNFIYYLCIVVNATYNLVLVSFHDLQRFTAGSVFSVVGFAMFVLAFRGWDARGLLSARIAAEVLSAVIFYFFAQSLLKEKKLG